MSERVLDENRWDLLQEALEDMLEQIDLATSELGGGLYCAWIGKNPRPAIERNVS